MNPGPKRPLVAAAITTVAVTAFSWLAPPDVAATLVGATFLGAGYWLVLRHDHQTIRDHGLLLGGLFDGQPLAPMRLLESGGRALGWALAASLVCLPPFFLGYQWWFRPEAPFTFVQPEDPVDEVLGQLFAVALPEELFYRGYLQSALDRAWPPRWRVFGATIGLGLLVSSAIFALGHLLTTPNPARLSVFFPSLVFGWLRARTGGIGAPVLFHASSNLFSATLARGYGFMLP